MTGRRRSPRAESTGGVRRNASHRVGWNSGTARREVACPCSADPSRERLSAVAGCSATPTSRPSTPSPPPSAIRRFRKGETVFHQGDPGDALFIVASGSVKVVLPSRRGRRAGDRRDPRRGRVLRRAGDPRRRAAFGDDRRDRADRDARPPSRRVPRADRQRAGAAPGAAGLARDGDPPADRPRRGPPLPRPARPPRVADRAARRSSASPTPDGASGSPGRTPSPSWPG